MPRSTSLVLTIALVGCGEVATGEPPTSESSGSETGTETESETGGDELPSVIGEPQIIKHPNQPMVVDVIVELDRPGLVELAHDDDPGVRAVSLAVEQNGRHHHLRVRGLAPASEHALTLTLRDLDDAAGSTTQALAFTTNTQQRGFRPSFEVEVGDAAAVDPSYRMFDYANVPLVDPVGIFVVDPQGVTRWYYNGGVPGYIGLTAVWAGIELLDDGSVLGVRDGVIVVLDELGERRVALAATDYELPLFHHDVERLANGNYLSLSTSFATHDYSSFGLDAEQYVAGDLLVELDPAGEIVWTWDAFDHLDPLRLRSGPNEGLPYYDPQTGKYGYDWTHGNGMIELADEGLILLCMRHQDWIVAIDHETGEVAWRFGPEGDFELLDGSWFYHPHSPQMQPDGSLLLYDNAVGNPEGPDALVWSRAVRYAIDFEAMTATQVWDSRHGEPYASPVAGDADRMPSGNILMLDSALQPDGAAFDLGKNSSRLVELPSEGEARAIWSLTTKLGSYVYRATAIDRLPGEGA